MNYQYITNFHKSRENKIGASDIPMLIPSPNRPIESLAAFTKDGQRQHMTALDLYNEKINPSPYEYNFSADMGHYLEGKALYEFISDNISRDIAIEFLRGYQLHKIEQDNENYKRSTANRPQICVYPEPFNNTPFKHNTEASNDFGVAHGDCLYVPPNNGQFKNSWLPMKQDKNGDWILDINGLKINMSKPFLIEAKSARSYVVSARKHDQYKGYDLNLKSWQGIPLKVYFQCQFQMLLYNVDVCYVSLIFDTSEKHYWQIEKNENHQKDLIQIASYMKKCIDEKTPPKELVMNSKDIQSLYPETKEDFKEVTENELDELVNIAKDYYTAKRQEKIWSDRKEDAKERMSIHLKDTEKIKGKIGDSITDIAKWKYTGGGRSVMGLGEIEKRDDGQTILKYFKRKGLIKIGKQNRKPSIVVKEKELEL